MKHLFALYAIITFIAGCCGAIHHFALSVICLILSIALWFEHKKEKEKCDFFD